MDMPTVTTEERQQARVAVAEYAREVKERHRTEDEQILRCYREIARGRPVINVIDAIRDAGPHPLAPYFPLLALARADWLRVWASRTSADGDLRFWRTPRSWRRETGESRYAAGALPMLEAGAVRPPAVSTIVPIVPPALRPGADLSRYWILFEVERWEPVAPRDPLLLRHLSGSLYAVLAHWDLTEVERAVIARTR